MTYAELLTALIEDTHRPDLAGQGPRFVRQAEGMIRRDLTAYPLSAQLTDADRPGGDGPVYMLSGTVNIVRALADESRRGDALDRVAPAALTRVGASERPKVYAQLARDMLEIRGTPAVGATFRLDYYGIPAPLIDPDDTNELLADHESLYLEAAKFFAYRFTEDRELAGDALDVFNGVVTTLNEQVSRQLGGASVAPSYHFGNGGAY